MFATCKALLTRRSAPARHLAMGSSAPRRLQVLFCGEEFTWGFRFSKEALEAEPDIEASSVVSFAACIMACTFDSIKMPVRSSLL